LEAGVRFEGHVCVVTGASSGIGRALALELTRRGAHVWALGRDADRLAAVAAEGEAGRISPLPADLGDEDALRRAALEISSADPGVDVLAHCAGAIVRGPVETAQAAELDALYDVTVRGPFVLTRELLPAVRSARGQIVFINSLVPPDGANDAVLYAAMKQAARVFANGLRQEVNLDGIRVTTVAPGRTDTPMQERVHEYEERDYDPELLLDPADVVGVVLAALTVGPRGEVTDVQLRPTVRFGARRP
jgi:NAD(P)-dependent dehydrogenase (short-subunit alcohol dehydrogenase family)